MGFWELDAENVVKAVKEWIPGPVFTEERCRDSLFNFLLEKFPKQSLTKEEPVSTGRADIMIKLKDWLGVAGATVAIEMKYNLTDANEYKRLIGQMAEYIRDKYELIVVLCGNTKPEFAEGVLKHMTTLSAAGRFAFKGYVVQKPVGKRTDKGKFLPGNSRPVSKA